MSDNNATDALKEILRIAYYKHDEICGCPGLHDYKYWVDVYKKNGSGDSCFCIVNQIELIASRALGIEIPWKGDGHVQSDD